MNVGKPQRVHRVEPLRSPVPDKPDREKVTAPETPAKAPAK
jgi:hypothetical protein